MCIDYTEYYAGCGAFCAVTQANRIKSDRLVRLKYSPGVGKEKDDSTWSFPHTGVTITDAARSSGAGVEGGGGVGGGGVGGTLLGSLRPVVLVGKGVCYDTGGKSNTYIITFSSSLTLILLISQFVISFVLCFKLTV